MPFGCVSPTHIPFGNSFDPASSAAVKWRIWDKLLWYVAEMVKQATVVVAEMDKQAVVVAEIVKQTVMVAESVKQAVVMVEMVKPFLASALF